MQCSFFDANVVTLLQILVLSGCVAYRKGGIRYRWCSSHCSLWRNLPTAFFQVTWGLGNPSALHSTLASDPWAKALSVGSSIHLGGTVVVVVEVVEKIIC